MNRDDTILLAALIIAVGLYLGRSNIDVNQYNNQQVGLPPTAAQSPFAAIGASLGSVFGALF
jgi:hypothetical protein